MLSWLSGCAALSPGSPTASDSFCTAYQQLIQAQGEGTINAKRAVMERIYANEKTYVCLCTKNPDPKICAQP